MRTLLLLLILLCGAPVLGEEGFRNLPKGSIVLNFHLRLEIGGRIVEMKPTIAVNDGQSAELEIFSDKGEEEYVRLSAKPRLGVNNKVDLELHISSGLAGCAIQRKLRLTALLDSESLYQVTDAKNREKISLTVKPHLVD